MNRDQSRQADARVLGALDVPRTTKEITQMLRVELWEAWAEEEGVELEYNDDGMPLHAGHRLASFARAHELGTPMLSNQHVYQRLVKLEKLGLVHRVMMPSHTRSILWFRPISETADGLDRQNS